MSDGEGIYDVVQLDVFFTIYSMVLVAVLGRFLVFIIFLSDFEDGLK